jgi:hypothetical protein
VNIRYCSTQKSRLAGLIDRFEHSLCTDVHDHIHILLSLGELASKSIIPDYIKDRLEISSDVARFLMSGH